MYTLISLIVLIMFVLMIIFRYMFLPLLKISWRFTIGLCGITLRLIVYGAVLLFVISLACFS